MDESPDRGLVLRTRRGEVEAFGQLVNGHQTSVFNVCYRMLGERREAEDLTQETFIRAYRRLNTYNVELPFGPWIRRVAANLCLNHLKKSRVVRVPLIDEVDVSFEETTQNPEMIRQHAEQEEAVRAAILELPPHYRAVIELRHFQEMSYAEISEALDIPMSDVKSHLFRARKLLSKKLRNDV